MRKLQEYKMGIYRIVWKELAMTVIKFQGSVNSFDEWKKNDWSIAFPLTTKNYPIKRNDQIDVSISPFLASFHKVYK